ncbi:MAG: DUF3618 domain-containing protein [Candidatus Eremiobacteraeota bacterium]|nr:DUF3618 domain-containing protein [Candidatus Eremiobacteraeota bacterium]
MNNENDPQAIREEIEATRERMADTAEALAYKSDVPARVKDKVNAKVEDVKSAARDAASAVGSKLSGASESARNNVQDFTETAKSALGDAADNAKSSLNTAAQSTRTAVGNASDAANDLTARARDTIGTPSSDQGAALGSNAKNFVAENPLALAVASIATGFLVGLALPVSTMERENVGPLSERVASEAKAKAGDLAQQGKAAVVSAVTDTLTQGSSRSS